MAERFSGDDVDEWFEPQIRISLDGSWSAAEFAELLEHLQFLNNVAHMGQAGSVHPELFGYYARRYHFRGRFDGFPDDLQLELQEESRFVRRMVAAMSEGFERGPGRPLTITQMHLASPGNLDLGGFGKVAEETRKFLEGIMDRWISRPDRKIARESAQQDVFQKQIENAERLANLGEKVGLSPDERQQIVREVLRAGRFVEGKVLEKKITDVKLLE